MWKNLGIYKPRPVRTNAIDGLFETRLVAPSFTAVSRLASGQLIRPSKTV
jgi:hypothetical protein